MSAEKERLILLNRRLHAPKLGTTFGTGFENTQDMQIGWDVAEQAFMPIDCCDENDIPGLVWEDDPNKQPPNGSWRKVLPYDGLLVNTTFSTSEYQLKFGFSLQQAGDLVYRANNAWARLPAGSTGFVLTSGGAQGLPSWGTPGGSLGNEKYLIIGSAQGLSQARTFASSAPLTFVDGGAGNALTVSLAVTNSEFDTSNNSLELKDAGVQQSKMAFQPRSDTFTGQGGANAASSFNLSYRIITSAWRDALIVTRNGQVLEQLATNSTPSSSSEFKCTDDGVNTTITLGSTLGAAQKLKVVYFA